MKAKHYYEDNRKMYRTEIQMTRMVRKACNFFVPTKP